MLPPALAVETITVQRPVMVSSRGVDVPDYDQPPAQVLTVPGCSVQPAKGSEDRAGRDQSGAVFTVWAPPGTEVGTFDLVLVAQYPTPLRTVGEPQEWATGLGLDHVVFDLAGWEG